jgi:hypothetical protein
MLSNAKLAYMLSTCPKLNNGLMSVMLKQFGASKTVATRHYFELWVHLHEPHTIDEKNSSGLISNNFTENSKIADFKSTYESTEFKVKRVKFKFAGSKDPAIINALQYNNYCNLTSDEMINIHNNLLKVDITLNAHQIVAIYSIATLIKKYKAANFTYLFIPVILDYGRGGGIVHQTALIIDLVENKFIYYEPYGVYKKYNLSYKNAVGELLSCFNNFSDMSGKDKISYTTYHDMLGLNKGIQKILLEKNNERSEEFNKKYDMLLQKLKETFPNENFEPNNKTSDITDDKTLKILNLLHNIDNFYIDNLSEEDTYKYHEILNEAFIQYHDYNSKTCVSITMVELDKFFKMTQDNVHIRDIPEKIKSYYTRYTNVENPNDILMTDIYKLVDLFKDTKKFKNILAAANQTHTVCSEL